MVCRSRPQASARGSAGSTACGRRARLACLVVTTAALPETTGSPNGGFGMLQCGICSERPQWADRDGAVSLIKPGCRIHSGQDANVGVAGLSRAFGARAGCRKKSASPRPDPANIAADRCAAAPSPTRSPPGGQGPTIGPGPPLRCSLDGRPDRRPLQGVPMDEGPIPTFPRRPPSPSSVGSGARSATSAAAR